MTGVPQPPRDFDVVAFGAINIDYVVAGPTLIAEMDELEKGTESHVRDYKTIRSYLRRMVERPTRQLGGAALVTARTIASLDPDLRVGIVAAQGRIPATLLRGLPSNLHLLTTPYAGPPGTCVSVLEDDDRKLFTYNDEAAVTALLTDHASEVVAWLSSSPLIYVTSVFGPGVMRSVGGILSKVRRRRPDITMVVDLGEVWARGSVDDVSAVLRNADILVVNQEELHLLGGGGLDDDDVVRTVVSRYCVRAEGVVLLKKRAAGEGEPRELAASAARAQRTGAIYYRTGHAGEITGREAILREALPSQLVADSTGAGDVFAAGVITGLISGRVRTILALRLGNALARHKLQRPGEAAYGDMRAVVYGDDLPAGRGKIFLSHAEADMPLARALQELLSAGASHPVGQDFYCSSIVGLRSAPGTDFSRDVWWNLRAARWVVFIVTDAFVASRWCLYEVGVTSALGLPSVPLLAPGYRFDDPGLPVNDQRGAYLTNLQFLSEFRDEVAVHIGASAVSTRKLNRLATTVSNEAVLRSRAVWPGPVTRPTTP